MLSRSCSAIPELRKAIDEGRESDAKRLATEYLLGITFGVAGAKGSGGGTPSLRLLGRASSQPTLSVLLPLAKPHNSV